MKKEIKIAILGASGLVGKKLIRLFERYSSLNAENFSFFSSERMKGKSILFKNKKIYFEFLEDQMLDFEIVFLCTNEEISKKYIQQLISKKVVMIDNSSAFRLKKDIPLIIPEINGKKLNDNNNIISSPNCIVSILLTGLLPILKDYKIKKIVLSTYQSVSGAGYSALNELKNQVINYINGEKIVPQHFKYPIAFNLFSHDSAVNKIGNNGEEEKIIAEVKKILNEEKIEINVTCVRVPIFFCHSISAYIELDKEVDISLIKKNASLYKSIQLLDDCEKNLYPMPINVSGKKKVYIGRLRKDANNPFAMNIWIVGDQLLKGAALNLFQIARLIFGEKIK